MRKIVLILIISVFILIGGSYYYLGMKKHREKGWFIKKDFVEGSSITANGLEYTLNYAQQEGMLDEINNSKKVEKPPSITYIPGAIESINVYFFDQETPLVLIPAANDFSLFKVAASEKPFYLRLDEPEDLDIILELAYDR
jgi:hypothetical protein